MNAMLPALTSLGALAALVPFAVATTRLQEEDGHALASATIVEDDLAAHLLQIAAPELLGRNSPGAGLERAARYIEEVFAEAGFRGFGSADSFRHAFPMEMVVPDPAKCSLEVEGLAPFVFETDYVPLFQCEGEGAGEAVFVGFGISSKKERYDDFKRTKLRGNVAVILEGEPRHKRVLEGPEVTELADVHTKLADLEKEGVAGVLVVRRPPDPGKRGLAPTPLGYRYTFARWNPQTTKPMRPVKQRLELPVLEITPAAAERILGFDVLATAEKIDKAGKPVSTKPSGHEVRLSSGLKNGSVQVDNVVGVLEGSDPELAGEFVVIGAHYDHVGVDTRGRIGTGADDNGSGTVALLELVQAFGAAKPRRSILACAFASEEKGLMGSHALCQNPPVAAGSMVAMLNMDMVGRGEDDLVVVLGTKQNPDLEKVLKEAKKLSSTGIKKIETGKAEHLWQRSDHYSFHEIGVPVLFFFEAVSETENEDYHTFRDTIELLSVEKIANTARFAFNTAWLLANDDDRPPAPKD